MEKLSVRLGDRSYKIIIKPGIIEDIGNFVKPVLEDNKVMIVTDENVNMVYGQTTKKSLDQHGIETCLSVVQPGESSKTLSVAEHLLEECLNKGLKRTSTIIALGGGVVGDLAGFVAATYMRGINYVQIPTTLLAQVDSSIGGKVAVNLTQAKNIVGTFYQPKLVLIDPNTLSSLPEREFRAGMSEVIKYGVIRDEEFFYWLEKNIDHLKDIRNLIYIIKKSCQIKARIVERDEEDRGIRAILNFGHTIGHALEAAGRYSVFKHGEAVAIGQVTESKMACNRGLITQDVVDRIDNLLKKVGLETKIPESFKEEILKNIKNDKKSTVENNYFVLPIALGKVDLFPVSMKEIRENIF